MKNKHLTMVFKKKIPSVDPFFWNGRGHTPPMKYEDSLYNIISKFHNNRSTKTKVIARKRGVLIFIISSDPFSASSRQASDTIESNTWLGIYIWAN